MYVNILSVFPPDQHQRFSCLNDIIRFDQDLLDGGRGSAVRELLVRSNRDLQFHSLQDYDDSIFVDGIALLHLDLPHVGIQGRFDGDDLRICIQLSASVVFRD
jgi:hypothetical protein